MKRSTQLWHGPVDYWINLAQLALLRAGSLHGETVTTPTPDEVQQMRASINDAKQALNKIDALLDTIARDSVDDVKFITGVWKAAVAANDMRTAIPAARTLVLLQGGTPPEVPLV